MTFMINQPQFRQQIISKLEESLQNIGSLSGTLEVKVTATAANFLKIKTRETSISQQEVQELCIGRLSQHCEDVLYLVQKRIPLEKILTILCCANYRDRWGMLFKNENFLLKMPDCHSQSMTSAYTQWLVQNTTYQEILSKNVANFRLRPAYLMEIFCVAARILGSRRQQAKIFQTEVKKPVTSIIVYQEHTSAARFNLLFWQQDKRRFFLGQGAQNTVWKVIDLAKGCFLALKHPIRCVNNRSARVAFEQELNIWSILRESHVGIVDYPETLVVDREVLALVGKCYEGDAIDFLQRLKLESLVLGMENAQASSHKNNYANVTVKEVLIGFLNALYGLQVLSSHKICHRDIKQDNLFFEFSTEGCQLKFVLADFGFAETYDNIIKNEDLGGSFPITANKNDTNSLIDLFKKTPIETEAIEALLEKREVCAFGYAMFRHFIYCDIRSDISLTMEKKNRFLSCYGERVYEFLQWMVAEDHHQRPSVTEAIKALELIINTPLEVDACLSQPFQQALLSFTRENDLPSDKKKKSSSFSDNDLYDKRELLPNTDVWID